MPTHDGKSTMIGNKADGYAKITLLEKTSPLDGEKPPISLTDLELTPFFENNTLNYETVLPASPYKTTITYDETKFMWAHNVGETTLEKDKIHQKKMENLHQKGVQILQNSVKICKEDSGWIIQGDFLLEEQIGIGKEGEQIAE